MTRTPPQPPPRFKHITPSSIHEEIANDLLLTSQLHSQLISALSPATATFSNLIRPLLDRANHSDRNTLIPSFLLGRVSPDPAIRQAARDARAILEEGLTAALAQPALAALVSAVYTKERDNPNLSPEERHVLAYVYEEYLRTGGTLPDEDARARLAVAKAAISDARAAAIKAFTENADAEGMWLPRIELAGCGERFISRLKTDGDQVWVTFRDEHYSQVLRCVEERETRKRYFLAAQSRLPENVVRLEELVVRRDEVARLLGFANHAELRIQDTMGKSVSRLREALLELHQRLQPLVRAEMSVLADVGDLEELYIWDRLYLTHVLTEKRFAVDNAKVAEYFEIGNTVAEMLCVFAELFGMEFVASKDMETWHESVLPFEVWNSESEGEGFLGYLYIDIYSRPNKFSSQYHSRIRRVSSLLFACSNIYMLTVQGFFDADGVRHYPVSALVCSYPQSVSDKPSLLPHRDVRILFHELGHAIHHLVDQSQLASGQSRDFYEIPSKMLEHFVWVPDVIIRLSKHYTALGKSSTPDNAMPEELAQAVARTKLVGKATGLMSFIHPSLFDLAIHTPQSHQEAIDLDTTTLWNEMRCQYAPYQAPTEERIFGQASFSALFRGYDVGYFTYVM